MMNKENHLFTVELTNIYKGIAILCVIFSHIGNYFTRIFTPLGGIGVAIFLALSGYGLSISYERNGLKYYWRKRFIAVWIPYIFIELITAPLRQITIVDVIGDITLFRPQFMLGWYLNYLLLWYIVFWIVNSLNISEKNKWRIFGTIAIVLAIYFNFNSSIRFEQSLSFLTGILIAKKNLKKYITKLNGIMALVAAIIILAIKQTGYIRQQSQTILNIVDLLIKNFALIGILILGYILFNSLRKQNGILKCLEKIGVISYELYLVHGYALGIFNLDYSTLLCIILFLSVSLGGAVILWIIDKFICNHVKNWLLRDAKIVI